MVSFQRMRDELDNLETQVANKFPVMGRTGCLVMVSIAVFVLFIIGFAIGYGVHRQGKDGTTAAALASPNYVFISNNSQSCPPLVGERILTTVAHGQSFEGLVVNMACRGNFNPFPNQVKCRRKNPFDDNSALEWSHLPVCYPSMLVSKTHWEITLHARSVSCTGDSQSTQCQLSCIRDYIAVESSPYRCTKPPCRAWTLADAHCFMCDKMCGEMHDVQNPEPDALVTTLTCSCDKIIVASSGRAAIWQNKRTGLFSFSGEHNGRPVYQNKATKEYLFYTMTGSQWLVGPDFRKPHAGIQVLGNDDTQCPENYGGRNVSKLYIDSSEPSPGGTGKWTVDESLSFKCLTDSYRPVECKCDTYKVFHTVYEDGEAPSAVTYMMGEFDKIDQNAVGLMAPLYFNREKDLYLFSHHPKGLVWQVSTKLSTTPLRGISLDKDSQTACPDTDQIRWEWFNTTTPQGQQLYIEDSHIQVKCIS